MTDDYLLKDQATARRNLTTLEKAATRVIEGPQPTDDRVADALGRILFVERKLGQYRRGLAAESPDVKGKDYELVTVRRASRSYNTQGLLAKFANATGSGSPLEAIRRLIDSGALRLTWSYRKLLKAAADFDVTIATAKHEIEDGDPEADIGEVWTEAQQVKGVKK